MSLRYAVLGLLANQPGSGYDLTQRFDAVLGRHAWHAQHSQIYPELKRLSNEGLVTVVEEGPRGRRTYDVTETGRTELRAWMRDYPEAGVVRNEYALRLFFLGALDPAEARVLLEKYLEAGEEQAQAIHAIRPELNQQPLLGFGRLAAEFGQRYFEMQRDWATWAIEQLDQENDP